MSRKTSNDCLMALIDHRRGVVICLLSEFERNFKLTSVDYRVEAPQVLAVAEGLGATPFDIEGVFWSHRGETCTFDTMLTEFGKRCSRSPRNYCAKGQYGAT